MRQHLPGRAPGGGRGPQQRVRARHHQRGRHALVRHVPRHHHHAAVAELHEVIEVAAHRARRTVERRDVPAAEFRELVGQELLLDELRDLQLLLDPLEVAGLGLLLADQLAQPKGRRRVPGEGVEEVPVVAGVAALRQPRAERQHADQLPRRHQRHHHLDVLLLHPAHRRRERGQRRDVHRAGRRRQERQERVGRLDVDVDHRRLGRHMDRGLRPLRPTAQAATGGRRRRPRPGVPVTGSGRTSGAGGAPRAGRGTLPRRVLLGGRDERSGHVTSRCSWCGVRPAVVVGTQHPQPSVSGALRRSPLRGLRNAPRTGLRYGRRRPGRMSHRERRGPPAPPPLRPATRRARRRDAALRHPQGRRTARLPRCHGPRPLPGCAGHAALAGRRPCPGAGHPAPHPVRDGTGGTRARGRAGRRPARRRRRPLRRHGVPGPRERGRRGLVAPRRRPRRRRLPRGLLAPGQPGLRGLAARHRRLAAGPALGAARPARHRERRRGRPRRCPRLRPAAHRRGPPERARARRPRPRDGLDR